MLRSFEKELEQSLEAAAPSAPPITRPAPPKPIPPTKPKRSPWRPPKPQSVPGPKLCEQANPLLELLVEDYETDTHATTRDFWKNLPRNKQHLLGQHPIFALFGNELSRAGYEFVSKRAEQSGLSVRDLIYKLAQILHTIQSIEHGHQEELEALAVQVVRKIWKVPEDAVNFDAQLSTGPDLPEDTEPGEAPRAEVNKRLTLNLLTHGSAVHAMQSAHHLVNTAIKQIDPRLLDLYNSISSGSHQYYWLINIPAILQSLLGAAVGSTRVTIQSKDEAPTITSKGIIFPVLCQELCKGIAELISWHGLESIPDPKEVQAVIRTADDVRYEPYLIQIGPELWRRFLKVIPRSVPLAEIYQALAMQTPDDVQKIIMAVIEEPEQARQLLAELIQEPEEFDVAEWQPEEQEDL
jgi:hypothetical protein